MISAQQHHVEMDWTLNCAWHAKGPSDGIGADVKGTINAEQMLDTDDRPTRVENCQQVHDAPMPRKLLFRRKPIWDKNDLRGATGRFAFFVPNRGRVGRCATASARLPHAGRVQAERCGS